jgi:hypothetical protein
VPCPNPSMPNNPRKRAPALKKGGVIVVTSDQDEELEGTKFFAAALHGKDTVVQFVKSPDDMVTFLSGFESIHRLVFMFHGDSGQMKIGVNMVYLSEIARLMLCQESIPHCDELAFEGCHVGSGGPEVVKLMDAVSAKSATGYAAFHAWGRFGIQVSKGDSAASLENGTLYKRYKRFVVSGQSTPADLVRHPGLHSLAFEFFTSTPTEPDVVATGLQGQVDRLVDRGKLERRSFSTKDAEQAKRYDTISGSMTIITIKR